LAWNTACSTRCHAASSSVVEAGRVYRRNTCPLLTQRKALSAVMLKQCNKEKP
jgi:hypothetical protein